jgi:hypothetical protein
VRRGSVGTCLSCNADSECMTGATCAPVNPARGVTGNHCLPIRITTCGALRPYAEGATVTTASGASANICRSRTTTCEAVLLYGAPSVQGTNRCTNDPPAGTNDAACGRAEVADGLCRTTSGLDNWCTYPCLGDADCRVASTCQPDPMDGTRNICSL